MENFQVRALKMPKNEILKVLACMQAPVRKTTVEIKQFPQIVAVEMNKYLNLDISENFNEKNSIKFQNMPKITYFRILIRHT